MYTGTHLRWTQKQKGFPKNKYRFSEFLKRKGDFIVTFPLEWPEVKKISDAAYLWAWHKKRRVRVHRLRMSETTWEVRIYLTEMHRIRDFG